MAVRTPTRFGATVVKATRESVCSSAIFPELTIKSEPGSPSSSELSSPPPSDEDESKSSRYFRSAATIPTVIKHEELSPLAIKNEDSFPAIKVEKPATPNQKKRRRVKQELSSDDEPPHSMGDIPSILPRIAKTSVSSPPEPKHATNSKKKGPSAIPPQHWEEMYNLTKEMRLSQPAPVDTMGCERVADRTASPLIQRFQTLTSLMLSSQTKDTVNAATMDKLRAQLPGGLTLQSILAVDPPELNRIIGSVGFHRRKTEYLKKTAEILQKRFDSDIPNSIEGLMSLPGVGPKMAHLCMSAAWNKTMGIGVDVHVHRISNLWGWVQTTNPEGTREGLEAWLPREKWREVNWLLVGFGQTICLPRGRKCGECKLSKGLCRAAYQGDTAAKRKKKIKVEKVKDEEGDNDEWGGEISGKSDAEFNMPVSADENFTAEKPKRRLRRRVVKVEAKTEDGWEGMTDIEDAVSA